MISDIFGDSKGSELYKCISAQTGIPQATFRLLRDTFLIKPGKTLLQSHLDNGCTLQLSMPCFGGGRGRFIAMRLYSL